MASVKKENLKLDEELVSQIHALRKRGKQIGLRDEEIRSLFALGKMKHSPFSLWLLKMKILVRRHFTNTSRKVRIRNAVIALCVSVISMVIMLPFTPTVNDYLHETFIDDPCLVSNSIVFTEILRPRVPCAMCQNMSSVPVVTNISKEEFFTKYAYTGVPVLVKDAIVDWEALTSFSYSYLKDIYQEKDEALDYVQEHCQFFRYKTEFKSLADVFAMEDDRAALEEGTQPWYVGWSNCDVVQSPVGRILRTQYQRPYFLPDQSSSMDADWIFMGGPGNGANLHIDYVDTPSWQAQVSGSKTWTLEPSPECSSLCKTLHITVEKGDIFVLNTNIWYHKTEVNLGDISITIGAEYD